MPLPSDYGFVEPKAGLATGEDEAVTLADRIGYPVVLKVSSPDILHKTEVGGVELGLASEQAVRAAFRRIHAGASEKAPTARLDGVRVEEMVSEGFEIIIGLKNDAQFGPVIMFGLGGIFTELLDDVSFRVLPITEDDARQMVADIRGAPILQGFRGQIPVSSALLTHLLLSAARFGLALGDRLESVDLNPVVVWEDMHRLLDSKVVVRDEPAALAPVSGARAGPAAATRPQPNVNHLATFFEARSVAVVGASATPGKIGHAAFVNLAKHEYEGKVFPVNPTKKSVLGLQSYPSVTAISEKVELVLCTVELALVPALIRECAARDIHAVIVVSGGGKELGGDPAALEAEIRRVAHDLDVRVIGPNCIGVFDGVTRLDTFFHPHARMTRPRAGPVAMTSQSGTMGLAFLEDMSGVGVSKFVSYGNRVDVDEADLLAYLADDPVTRVIAMYVEGFEDGRKFLEAARRTAARKPVVILKAGRTPAAARAALTHTGFLAGSPKLAEGAFRQAGVIGVDTYEELVAVSQALALQPRAPGPRVAMIGNGIGPTVQALDILAANGLEPAVLAPHTVERLTNIYPPFYIVQNPLDVTGSGTDEDYEVGIRALLDDPGVDIVMPWMVFQATVLGDDFADKLGALNRTASKPMLVGATGGAYTRRISAEIERRGVPVFHSVRDWVAAARGLAFQAARYGAQP